VEDIALAEVVRSIHASGWQLVVAVTGGGSGAVAALLQTPGASRSVLEATSPYSTAALADWLGGAPAQACAAETARSMAMASFFRARELAPDAPPDRLLGVGCTASLASDRPKRGDHRLHVATQTATDMHSDSVTLAKGRRTRASEEALAAEMVVLAVAAACGALAPRRDSVPTGGDDEPVLREHERLPAAITELLVGQRRAAVLRAQATSEYFSSAEAPPLPVVFPGAFNPPHSGHLHMAAEAQRRTGLPVAWELSLANVDKPPLDYISLKSRLSRLRHEDSQRLAVVTRAPTFGEKAELFPGATFVVGADTIVRIGDARYYGGDFSRRDASIAAISRRGCRFLVFGRQVAGRFQTLHELSVPPALRALCDEVPAEEFREDVSSTALRGGA